MASIVRNSRQIIWNHALISIVIQAIELKDVFRNSIISLPNRSYYSRSSNALGGLSMSTSSHTMVVDHKPRWCSKSPIGVFPITIFWIAFLITTCNMPITATTMTTSSMWFLRSELKKSGSKDFYGKTNVKISISYHFHKYQYCLFPPSRMCLIRFGCTKTGQGLTEMLLKQPARPKTQGPGMTFRNL